MASSSAAATVEPAAGGSAAAAAAASTYIQTTTNSYVSRAATVDGAKSVEIKGRSIVRGGARLRGDLAPIRIGRCCLLDAGCAIEPPPAPFPDNSRRVPVAIGAHTAIGAGSVVRAAAVGGLCWIGGNVQAGPRCIIKDCCVVADGTVIPADTVVPPFHRVFTDADGRLCMVELPPSVAVELQERATNIYHEFVATQKRK